MNRTEGEALPHIEREKKLVRLASGLVRRTLKQVLLNVEKVRCLLAFQPVTQYHRNVYS